MTLKVDTFAPLFASQRCHANKRFNDQTNSSAHAL